MRDYNNPKKHLINGVSARQVGTQASPDEGL